jgi:hypothetical protein
VLFVLIVLIVLFFPRFRVRAIGGKLKVQCMPIAVFHRTITRGLCSTINGPNSTTVTTVFGGFFSGILTAFYAHWRPVANCGLSLWGVALLALFIAPLSALTAC